MGKSKGRVTYDPPLLPFNFMSCLNIDHPYDNTIYLGVLRNDLQAALAEVDEASTLPNHCSLNSSISWLFAAIENTQAQLIILGVAPDDTCYITDFDGEQLADFDEQLITCL
jgi:hypothetical protein